MKMFLVKMVGNGAIVVGLLMLLGDASFIGALGAALALTIIAYLLGDMVILQKTNNITATAVDAVLAFVLLWGISTNAEWNISVGDLLIITAALGVFEYIFHEMLYRMGYFEGDRKINI